MEKTMGDTRKYQELTVPMRLPGMNEILAQMSGHLTMGGGRVYRYTQSKARYGNAIVALIRSQGLRPVRSRVRLVFEWTEANRRRDPDNIAAGGRKFILDALQSAGILPRDGWRNVAGFVDRFLLGEDPLVRVLLIETGEAIPARPCRRPGCRTREERVAHAEV